MHVWQVEVEDLEEYRYCGCEFSTRIKKYGIYSSLDAAISGVQDNDGPVIKEVLGGEDWMLGTCHLEVDRADKALGAAFLIRDTSLDTPNLDAGKLMFVVRINRVEVQDG